MTPKEREVERILGNIFFACLAVFFLAYAAAKLVGY